MFLFSRIILFLIQKHFGFVEFVHMFLHEIDPGSLGLRHMNKLPLIIELICISFVSSLV